MILYSEACSHFSNRYLETGRMRGSRSRDRKTQKVERQKSIDAMNWVRVCPLLFDFRLHVAVDASLRA